MINKVPIEETTLYYQLSDVGKKIYLPKDTRVQAAEAKKHAHKYDATEGMAFSKKHVFSFKNISSYLKEMDIEEVVKYAPILGLPDLRELWTNELYRKNKSLKNKKFSKPVVTGGLTHGLSLAGDLFVDSETALLLPDLFWPNYEIIYKQRKNSTLITYNTFKNGKFDFDSFRDTIKKIDSKKRIFTIFTFPNNPTGYSLTNDEVSVAGKVIKNLAEEGHRITVLLDDAYFGLAYEDNVAEESLFSSLVDLHENIITIKIDGASKEYYGWGLRVGFITIAGKGIEDEHFSVLENKLSALTRSSISNTPKISQLLLKQMLLDKETEKEKEIYFNELKSRYKLVKKITDSTQSSVLEAFPFNSGYFMCFNVKTGQSDTLRRHLLANYGIGTIAFQDKYLRIAFACIDEKDIKDLYESLYKASTEYLDKNLIIKNIG